MSERMRPVPFGWLMSRALAEYREKGSQFGVHQIYRHAAGKSLPIFGETIETPFGPAAGPHTQLAQNLIAAYAGGSRFFELKTVQTLDGESLHVEKPCILALEEGYNVEWSTELTVEEAMDEYIKGWFALKLLSLELGLGGETGFVFNMSVGYDLEGIRSDKIDRFIEGLKDASRTDCFQACAEWTLQNLRLFRRVDAAFVRAVSPRVCRSVTLSTLHGCPREEIERIAAYLIEQKRLNTYVKCNPTLLGYDFVRQTLDRMGYDELAFDTRHFEGDLRFSDAVPMIERLLARAKRRGVAFGVKLSNTLPVNITRGELPGQEMYMSGKGLYPLAIALVKKLENAFGGRLRASYSGGADALNIADIFACGVWPITLATTLLKPGGYNRLKPMAEALAKEPYRAFDGVEMEKLDALCARAVTDARHVRPVKPTPVRKLDRRAPLADCFVAPCRESCPIRQDIPAYLDLVDAGDEIGALRVICEGNPLPRITGTICSHRCQAGCTRRFYEDAVQIRAAKLVAAERGLEGFLPSLRSGKPRSERVAVVGGGPAGMAAAFFAARAGAKVTLFEKRDSLGGVVGHIIPAFRISGHAVDADVKLLDALGVDIRLNAEVASVQALFEKGYTHAILAIGAWRPAVLALEGGASMDALAFLEAAKKRPETLPAARAVVVAGGGNTAIDAARAAVRLPGVKSVLLAYRRTRRQMPADLDEQELALADGVRFAELRNPVCLRDGVLTLDVTRLGQPDESGRQSPSPTGLTEAVPCDLLIAAIGQRTDSDYLIRNGVTLDDRGRARPPAQGDRLCVVGDALRGPATVAEAIADARDAVDALLGENAAAGGLSGGGKERAPRGTDLRARRGVLCGRASAQHEAARCLHCASLCENCVDVCPNRANVAVRAQGMAGEQVVHLDALCNECGNCASFCPYSGRPYRDKLTLFSTREDFARSDNEGVLPLEEGRALVRLNGRVYEDDAALSSTKAPARGLLLAALDLSQGR